MNRHTESQAKIILEFMMRARRRAHKVPFFFTLVVLASFFQTGQSVWSLGIPHQLYMFGTVRRFCDGMTDLNMEQKALCEENRDVMASIRYGATLAVKQCQYQFQYRRWNCSLPEQDRYTLFRRITGKGTKEAAFTYSISAAGVVYSIARSCVEGNLSVCGCSRERRPKNLNSEFQWGGCGDNIDYGSKYTMKFMKAGERKTEGDTSQQEMSKMNIHNIEVGIKVIKENVVLRCKCHGVSDSCEMKTCWKELSLFQDAGNDLLRKYDSAVKVKFDRKTRKIVKTTKITDDGYKRGGRRRSTSNRPSSDRLVYLNTSPDYCRRSSKHETLGTVGRECRGDTSGPGNCKELCCRRGFLSRTENTIERCECKFVWCCKVSCKQCMIARTKYNCL
ncbi:PREDICTED: protein Wnt-5a-like isoform X2 [Acropora digitifera]|uniref:protein Wnt-5a-like isoform X2 n=1 Tax=Acropora digitifera TaxID=70779 RepID=UPI00077AC94C|nr:PREDICTED: protein Wnt-5a-like isoform X2 [Acropora digitifera]